MGAKPSVAKVTCSAIEKIVMLRPRAFSEFACILISHLSKHFAGLETLQLATEQCCEDFILYIPDNGILCKFFIVPTHITNPKSFGVEENICEGEKDLV